MTCRHALFLRLHMEWGMMRCMLQTHALALMKMGKNIFLTGPAGSGKTHVLTEYITWLRTEGIPHAITASTGIAASHIGGQTIHSWSGIGVKDFLSDYDLDRMEQREPLVKRANAAAVLIIDEISMLSAPMLDMVDVVLRTVRHDEAPFGGMQVVLCGDFFQLPPVTRGGTALFAFHAECWRNGNFLSCYLEEQHRHEDSELTLILNALRNGMLPKEMHALIASRKGGAVPEDVPHLYTHNVDVDALNLARLAALKGKERRYMRKTAGAKKWVTLLERSVLAPEELGLKEPTAVMFIKNHPQGKFVNGTLGIVERFSGEMPVVKTRSGETLYVEEETWSLLDDGGEKVRAEITQLPLRLAWAVTVHKSQGMTLDAACMDLSKTFVAGQGYVALSRVRSLQGLYLTGITERAYERNPVVAEADAVFQAQSAQAMRRLESTPDERIGSLQQEFVKKHAKAELKKKGGDPKRIDKDTRSTYEKTHDLLKAKKDIATIAKERGVAESTIFSHLETLQKKGTLTLDDVLHCAPHEHFVAQCEEVGEVFKKTGDWKLTPVKEQVGDAYSYEDLRLIRLVLMIGEQEV
jgi:ATP-dependent DNA helicase PIF1